MFNVVPQWNPLRLAEDFATLHNLSGGRGDPRRGSRHRAARDAAPQRQGGVDRVARQPRSWPTTTDQPRDVRGVDGGRSSRALAEGDRSRTRASTSSSRPRASPIGAATVADADAGAAADVPVRDLAGGHAPADPRVRARSSTTAPCSGTSTTRSSSASGTTYGERVRRGPRRRRARAAARSGCWCSTCASRTRTRRPSTTARPGHDEFWKFLGPYGWSRGTWVTTASRSQPGLIPTLEKSLGQEDDAGGHARGGGRGHRSSTGPARLQAPRRSSRTSSATPTRRPTSR